MIMALVTGLLGGLLCLPACPVGWQEGRGLERKGGRGERERERERYLLHYFYRSFATASHFTHGTVPPSRTNWDWVPQRKTRFCATVAAASAAKIG